jgi:cytochrome P450
MTSNARKAPWLKLLMKLWTTTIEDRTHFFRIAAATGDIVRIPLGRCSTFIINDPEALSHILVHNESNYTKNGFSNQRLEPFLGAGLLTNSGEAWQVMRQQVQRQFYHKMIIQYLPLITNTTEKLLNSWSTRPGKTVDIVTEMSKLLLEITTITLFGADIHQHTATAIPHIRSANSYIVNGRFLNSSIPTPKNRRYRRGKDFINEVMREILNPPHNDTNQHEAALRCLWNQPQDTPEEQERNLGEAKNFLIAGHETTATALSWALYLLSKHPAIHRELLAEIDSVLNGNVPTLQQLDQLELTMMVIEETLRLYPPIWIFDRAAINEDIIGNYRVPAKSIVMIVPYTLHRHPKYSEQDLASVLANNWHS